MSAQTSAVLDSLNQKIRLLDELVQTGNFEQAQIESAAFRSFLTQNQLICPAPAVPLLSATYHSNRDQKNGIAFLAEVERDVRREKTPEGRAALLGSLIKEYGRWELPNMAMTAQEALSVVRDTLTARKSRSELLTLRKQLDSIQTVRQHENTERANTVKLDRDRAMMLAAAAGLVFLILLWANFFNSSKWRRRMADKELEMDLLRSELHRKEPLLPSPDDVVETPEIQQSAPEKNVPDPLDEMPVFNPASELTAFERIRNIVTEGDEMPKVALLIEPNRQIVLYLKSLLSDRFHIETADTANEGLQRANELLPDLIVCDAVLNGKTGIDVARQIKLSEKTNHIPIILLTDRFGNDGKLDALRAGADTWFSRPVLDDEFDASVKRLMDARKTQHSEFSKILHLYFTEQRQQVNDPFLYRSMQLIEEYISDPDFMADDLARKMQLSRHHFVKKMKVLTGKEPIQLIREMRLEKAKILLEKRAAPPQVIAELVGFSNPGTFALAFKEYFGENTLLLYTPPSRKNLPE